MTSSIDYSNLSNEEVSTIYAQGLQVYEDQITIMDFVRKKTTEVRNTLHELEVELKKRNIQIEKVEKQNE
jgi:hypothetical protein|tara:strand:- start:682 stop:891 length:210 start_codon:yes stop_codon:yes gene_type:complete